MFEFYNELISLSAVVYLFIGKIMPFIKTFSVVTIHLISVWSLCDSSCVVHSGVKKMLNVAQLGFGPLFCQECFHLQFLPFPC